jgi:hypothetical protein
VAYTSLPYFSYYLIHGTIFEEKLLNKIVRFDFLYKACLKLLRRIKQVMAKNVYSCLCKVPIVTVGFFIRNLNYLDRFSKYIHVSNFVKILPVGAELLHVDGRTGRYDEANSRLFSILRRRQKKG